MAVCSFSRQDVRLGYILNAAHDCTLTVPEGIARVREGVINCNAAQLREGLMIMAEAEVIPDQAKFEDVIPVLILCVSHVKDRGSFDDTELSLRVLTNFAISWTEATLFLWSNGFLAIYLEQHDAFSGRCQCFGAAIVWCIIRDCDQTALGSSRLVSDCANLWRLECSDIDAVAMKAYIGAISWYRAPNAVSGSDEELIVFVLSVLTREAVRSSSCSNSTAVYFLLHSLLLQIANVSHVPDRYILLKYLPEIWISVEKCFGAYKSVDVKTICLRLWSTIFSRMNKKDFAVKRFSGLPLGLFNQVFESAESEITGELIEFLTILIRQDQRLIDSVMNANIISYIFRGCERYKYGERMLCGEFLAEIMEMASVRQLGRIASVDVDFLRPLLMIVECGDSNIQRSVMNALRHMFETVSASEDEMLINTMREGFMQAQGLEFLHGVCEEHQEMAQSIVCRFGLDPSQSQ